MRYFLSLLFFIFPITVLAFDPSCFREVASINTASGIISFTVNDSHKSPIFLSKGTILPFLLQTAEKNLPISYSSLDSIDIRMITDSDAITNVQVDSYEIAKNDVTYTFDLGRVYEKNTLSLFLGYYTNGKVQFEISLDKKTFIPVSLDFIDKNDFRYFRITFFKQEKITGPTFIHTLHFYKKIQSRYIVASPGGIIDIYSDPVCQENIYNSYIRKTPYLSPESIPIATLSVIFTKNPLYKDDADSDGIENMNDNCLNIPNPDQKDRNRDGYGDACSDDDNDGSIGYSDNCPTIPNPDQKDQNVNNIGDACEFDTDNDGVVDAIDNAIRFPNPDQKDTDYDTIGDVIDNCILYNPDQRDLDKNGRGDACDRDEEYRKKNDEDKDGILDFQDNCRKSPNPDQLDTDKDGIGDICDNCISLQNTDQLDSDKNNIGDACEDVDKDGIEGWRDNCPTLSNSDQQDSDNNNIGDACTDTDSDTIYDSIDICPFIYDPDQKDIDKDKKGDLCDTDDNRFLESNKYMFMGLLGFFALGFILLIIFLMRRLAPSQK